MCEGVYILRSECEKKMGYSQELKSFESRWRPGSDTIDHQWREEAHFLEAQNSMVRPLLALHMETGFCFLHMFSCNVISMAFNEGNCT